jgi:CRISPR-associated protein Cas2
MYVLLVYDVNEKRVAKALKVCRGYLNWVQNSVFEGEITEGKLKELLLNLQKVIKKSEDSILLYKFDRKQAFEKEVIGQERSPVDSFV